MSETLPEVDQLLIPDMLERIAAELVRLRRHLAEPLRTRRRRLLITSTDNPIEIKGQEGKPWYSVLIENESAVAVEVAFSPRNGLPNRSDRRVLADTGKMLVDRFEHLSIGVDPAAVGAGVEVFVTLYNRPQVPVAFHLAGVADLVDVTDKAARELGRVTDQHGIEDSDMGAGVVVAPAAGGVIASIAAGGLPAGKYEVRVYAGISNAAAADINNLELQRGGVDLVSPLPHSVNGDWRETILPRVNLDGAQALEVKALAAGGAGVEYAAAIVATRLS